MQQYSYWRGVSSLRSVAMRISQRSTSISRLARAQQVGLARAVRGLHEDLQDVQGTIRDALPEDEPLVLGEAVHPFQEPLAHVVPFDQEYRRSG